MAVDAFVRWEAAIFVLTTRWHCCGVTAHSQVLDDGEGKVKTNLRLAMSSLMGPNAKRGAAETYDNPHIVDIASLEGFNTFLDEAFDEFCPPDKRDLDIDDKLDFDDRKVEVDVDVFLSWVERWYDDVCRCCFGGLVWVGLFFGLLVCLCGFVVPTTTVFLPAQWKNTHTMARACASPVGSQKNGACVCCLARLLPGTSPRPRRT